jgi:hypothetical protein
MIQTGGSDPPFPCYNSQVNHTTEPMTTKTYDAETWNMDSLATVTLTQRKWSTIRTALLCLSVDESVKGNHSDADYYLKAFNDLKEAMGD